VLYHHRDRRRLQDVLTCIRHRTTLHQAGTLLRPNDEFALRGPEELLELFSDTPDVVRRTADIADTCIFSLAELRYRYPARSLPAGYTLPQWLRELTWHGAHGRYGQDIPTGVARQLERELDLIEEMEYSGYFLTMWEIVEFCREQSILCQGRGSAANSAVCYCLGITAIDPVRMDLLFERFISKERAEPPDIDLDIEHGRREEVIQHVYESYGREHAAMVANVVRYRPRSAIREVGKTLGIPMTVLDRLAKLVSHHDTEIDDAFASAGLSLDSVTQHHFRALVSEILEFPRHISIHPGGFLLGAEPVNEIVPVENATMPGRTVIQWDKYDVDDMNLFKVDLLGLGALTHLHYAFDLLERHYGRSLSLSGIPSGDKRTFDLISRADTVGVFQLESRAQMAMLPQIQPRNFYDLVVQISIIRPGPITGGMVHPYLRRRLGEEPVTYSHPSLEPILKKTLGVPLFQEQVMKVAMAAADYSPDEADRLRRDMAAWRKHGRIEGHRTTLLERMKKKGISEQFASQVFEQIRGFGEYGFPESHAAGFAIVAYATAWLRTHYPALFTCALLNAWPMGFYAPSTIVSDARRHGITVLPVDVLRSKWECTLVADPGARQQQGLKHSRNGASAHGTDQRPHEATSQKGAPAIRMGLRFVKGLGSRHWERIARVQEEHPATLSDFVRQSGLDRGALTALARAGAFAVFGLDRRQALWQVLGREERAMDHEFDDDTPPNFSQLDSYQSILWDYGVTLHSTRGHPLEPHREELTERGFPEAADVSDLEDGSWVSYVGLVICRQRPSTAGGTVFLTLEDETGFVNLIVRKETFVRYRPLLITRSLLGVTGRLQARGATVHILVDSCFTPRTSFKAPHHESRDFH
jgi:error-prone DNA polymerase